MSSISQLQVGLYEQVLDEELEVILQRHPDLIAMTTATPSHKGRAYEKPKRRRGPQIASGHSHLAV